MKRLLLKCVAALLLWCLTVSPAEAQVFAQPIARGFTMPVAVAGDPVDESVFYVAELGGRVRVVRNHAILPADFLDLTGVVAGGGQAGLLGLVLSPDYVTSGRLFVFYVNQDGNTVLSRYTRSAVNPLQADPATRHDLTWSTGLPYIEQPYDIHQGGHLAFGPDGFLYLGIGDGGGENDPEHKAQDPLLLLGKMLRIDVNVTDEHFEGFTIPNNNPYFGRPDVLNEIWAFGVRNPWRWSFDNPGLGGTGAMLMSDVGETHWEELNFEPAGTAGGFNYGWRLREGAHDNPDVPTDPGPFSLPLTDPIFEYPREEGHSITGGYVYRGGALGPAAYGRYFFGEFILGRIWSLAIGDVDGVVTASDLVEHTDTVAGAANLPVSFGEDRFGELYVVTFADGRLYKLVPSLETHLQGTIDSPGGGSTGTPFVVSGFAADFMAEAGPGVATVHVWAVPTSGAATFLGSSYGEARPDIAAAYGDEFLLSGFSVPVESLPPGHYAIIAYAQSAVTGAFLGVHVISLDVAGNAVLTIEQPTAAGVYPGKVTVSGFAIDQSATSGTGVDAIHVWAVSETGAAIFVGDAPYGTARPDVAATYGNQFLNSGWSIVGANLSPGTWTIVAYLHSSVTNTFRLSTMVPVQIESGLRMSVDGPAANQVVQANQQFGVAGWALDLGAASGVGISEVHVWAVNNGTSQATFLGAVPVNGDRPDVAAAFGSSQFRFSGFGLSTSLPAGSYTLVVYAQSAHTGGFDIARVITISSQ